MACFLVPAAEAVVVTVAAKITKKKEKNEISQVDVKLEDTGNPVVEMAPRKVQFAQKLQWLSWLLWGGAFLLAYEHLWHGEIVPWFPFLTAAANPSDTAEMLHEMSTVGVSMAVLVTAAWAVLVYAVNRIVERKGGTVSTVEQGAQI